jgi:organic hydroperoxide reductase OsmC/OhrA
MTASPRIVRTARVSWLTHPPRGHAHVAVGGRAFTQLPLSYRGEEAEAETTTPGELLTAAHCSALALILSRILERDQTPARELTVAGAYTFTGDWYEIEAVEFTVHGRVEDVDSARFEQATREAVDLCGKSLGLPAGGAVALKAELA